MHTLDLFAGQAGQRQSVSRHAWLLRGFALPKENEVLDAVAGVARQAPFRTMATPGGCAMSVALTSCGELGWVSDRQGYRYSPVEPASGQPWPVMPAALRQLARQAAEAAGFQEFAPDACLLNRYLPGSRLSLHQDRDERDFSAPIVSVSLGMTAIFLFGGLRRGDKTARIGLHHGDVLVWGGADRLRYHGVLPLADAPQHPVLGRQRINLTFRKAG